MKNLIKKIKAFKLTSLRIVFITITSILILSIATAGNNSIPKNLTEIRLKTSVALSEDGCGYYTYWYKHPRTKKVYKICRDNDGYLVTKPGGGKDAWGRGYKWKDVKSGYGISKWYRSIKDHCTKCK